MQVYIETLGCKMNYIDSEKIKNALINLGFSISSKDTDYVIVNTCTVTQNADKKSIDKIKNYIKKNKKVIITGCLTRSKGFLAKSILNNTFIIHDINDVITFFRNEKEKQNLNFNNEINQTLKNRTRKFIAIQNGCDNFCSYCIVPSVRGVSNYKTKEDIIKEILDAENFGFNEIVLSGINLAAWGCSNTKHAYESRFSELLESILKKTSVKRIRISSLNIQYLDKKFFDILKNDRICDHLHLSIQSGSDKILKKMNRVSNKINIIEVIKKAREIRPYVSITADFIVGFPGETDIDFQESYNLAENYELSKLHIFPFSIRSGTAAEHIKNHIDKKTIEMRVKELRKLDEKLQERFFRKNIGQKKSVLWEQNSEGLTTNYLCIKGTNVNWNSIEDVIISRDVIVTKQLQKGN